MARSKRWSIVGRARKMLSKSASAGRTVTYGHLMEELRISRGRPLTALIGLVDGLEYSLGAPGFAAIIVRKDTGYPGGGYFCDPGLPANLRRDPRRGNDPKLSLTERVHILAERRKIWAYYRKEHRPPATT